MKAHFKRTPELPTIIGLMLLMPALITWLLLTAICYLTDCSSDFASLIIFAGLLCPLMSLGLGIVGRKYYENKCIYNKTLLVTASAFIATFFLIVFISIYHYKTSKVGNDAKNSFNRVCGSSDSCLQHIHRTTVKNGSLPVMLKNPRKFEEKRRLL